MTNRLILITALVVSTCAACHLIVVGSISNKLPDPYIIYFSTRAKHMTPNPPKNVRVGDHIRILRVPDADLKQREDEIARGAEMAGHTADTIDRIIAANPIVKVWQIDEFGYPWYEVTLVADDGQADEHTLMVYDDGTWEKVTK
jgi:hypothetical protein